MSNKAVAGIIGWPVNHSLSPRMHDYWLAKHGLAGHYVALPTQESELKARVASLAAEGLRGANVTIPHKEAVIAYMDRFDPVAKAIGAVNTIVVGRDGKLEGCNTDAEGFMQSVLPHLSKARKKAVMLGAGGAAKAVAYGLAQLGFEQIVILNRTLSKAQTLAAQVGKQAVAMDWQERQHTLAGADLLVNTTSLGLAGHEPLELDLGHLPKSALVTDIVFSPLETPLLVKAKSNGNRVVDGLWMLMYQGVPAFEAWFGVRPVVDEALRAHLMAGKA